MKRRMPMVRVPKRLDNSKVIMEELVGEGGREKLPRKCVQEKKLRSKIKIRKKKKKKERALPGSNR